jgi:hypothetical protein
MLTTSEGVSPETFKATFDAQDFKRRSVQTYHAFDVVMARQLVPLMLRPTCGSDIRVGLLRRSHCATLLKHRMDLYQRRTALKSS